MRPRRAIVGAVFIVGAMDLRLHYPYGSRCKTSPQPKLVSELYWKDGATGQHTINVTIKKKPYIVFVDEAGAGGNGVATRQAVCDLGLLPFPIARIIDMSD